jgi:hypothetical protein
MGQSQKQLRTLSSDILNKVHATSFGLERQAPCEDVCMEGGLVALQFAAMLPVSAGR